MVDCGAQDDTAATFKNLLEQAFDGTSGLQHPSENRRSCGIVDLQGGADIQDDGSCHVGDLFCPDTARSFVDFLPISTESEDSKCSAFTSTGLSSSVLLPMKVLVLGLTIPQPDHGR